MEANIRLGRLHQCTLEQACILKRRGFEGYREEMSLLYPGIRTNESPFSSIDEMQDMMRSFAMKKIVPELSVVAYVNDVPAGYVLIAMCTMGGKKLVWNGGTGVIPEFRGKGLASVMMREARQIIDDAGVDLALLEVLTENSKAIAAYRRGGFAIVDRLVTLSRTGAADLTSVWHERAHQVQLRLAHPREVGELSFYRQRTAWSNMWNMVPNGKALIASDQNGYSVAYALFAREKADNEVITLYQCEVMGDRTEREALLQQLLLEIYKQPDENTVCKVSNLSAANPEVIDLLQKAEFKRDYEQFLMALEKNELDGLPQAKRLERS